jgi:hypothetical protein
MFARMPFFYGTYSSHPPPLSRGKYVVNQIWEPRVVGALGRHDDTTLSCQFYILYEHRLLLMRAPFEPARSSHHRWFLQSHLRFIEKSMPSGSSLAP